jgi:hypothetical protein
MVCKLSALVALMLAAANAAADVLPFFRGSPPGPPIRAAIAKNNFVIERDKAATMARLIIPRDLLPKDASSQAPPTKGRILTSTLLAACCLTLVLFALSFVPRRRLLPVLLLASALAPALWAHASPRVDLPPPPEPGPPVVEVTIVPMAGVSIVPKGDAVRLVLPPPYRPTSFEGPR